MATHTDLPPLAHIAKQAGKLIKHMRPAILAAEARRQAGGSDEHFVEWKPDKSPVTIADQSAHELICHSIRQAYRDVPILSYLAPILSEEGKPEEMQAALASLTRFETDPLDGTATYLNPTPGHDGYSVNIGFVKDGQASEGAIYFPEKSGGRGELYYTQNGKAYMQVGDDAPKPIGVRKGPLRKPLKMAVGYNECHREHIGERECAMQQDAGQYRTCLVARGDCDVTGVNMGVGGNFHTYDIAAAHAVLKAAGGEIVTFDATAPEACTPFTYGQEHTNVPAHIAGSTDALLQLGLASKQALDAGKRR